MNASLAFVARCGKIGNVPIGPDQTIAPHLAFGNHIQILRAIWEQDAVVYEQVKCPAQFLWRLPPEPHDSFTQQSLAWKQKMVIPKIKTAMPQAQIEWLADSMHEWRSDGYPLRRCLGSVMATPKSWVPDRRDII